MRRSRTALRECAIEAGLHAIGVHGSEQDLARAQLLATRGPFHRVDPFVVPSAA